MLNRKDFDEILKLLKNEVSPAIGCTEPIAVAFAVTRACEILEEQPSHIKILLSANIYKNALGVGIPGTGMIGLPIAIALGVKIGRSEYGLEVLKDVNDESLKSAKQYLEQCPLDISIKEDISEKLYIEVQIEKDGNSSEVIITGQHLNIIKETRNGFVLFNKNQKQDAHESSQELELSIQKIYDFALGAEYDDISFIIKAGELNYKAAKISLEADYGHNVGKIFASKGGMYVFGNSVFSKILSHTSAACDARMAGAMIPVMSNSGSGNQGITSTLPVYIYAKSNKFNDIMLSRALVLSSLIAIYIKQTLGRLSALCGCVVAAMGSSCGITYLMGGEYNEICYAVKNMVANLTGMVCDGAKPSCSLKLASGVSMSLLSAVLAMEGQSATHLEGIIDEDVDVCIKNLTSIGRDAMSETDKLILNIMINKKNTCIL